MGIPVGELQTAFITLYRGDATLQGLLLGAVTPNWNIYDADGVPAILDLYSNYYVVVQQIMGAAGTVAAMDYDGADLFTQVSVFTQAGGFAKARAVAERIDKLTQRAQLALANGYGDVGTVRVAYGEVPGGNAITQHVWLRYRSWTTG